MSETLSRRAVLAGTCGTCAAVALTGCAAYSAGGPVAPAAPLTRSGEPSGSDSAEPTDDAEATSGAVAAGLIDAADVPVGGGVVLAAQNVVITQPFEGEFKAFSATCTHQGCAVNEVADGEISCPCHGSTFAVEDGAPTGGPAASPLEEREITMDGTSITLA